MAYDDLLRLSGPASGNSVEAASITIDADLAGGYRYFGKYRQGYVNSLISGEFDRTTGNETFQCDIYEATDAAGTGATLIASGASQTATHAANLGNSTANGKAAGTLSTGPTRIGFATGSGGWIKAVANVGGTTPIVGGVSVNVVPLSSAYLPSGV